MHAPARQPELAPVRPQRRQWWPRRERALRRHICLWRIGLCARTQGARTRVSTEFGRGRHRRGSRRARRQREGQDRCFASSSDNHKCSRRTRFRNHSERVGSHLHGTRRLQCSGWSNPFPTNDRSTMGLATGPTPCVISICTAPAPTPWLSPYVLQAHLFLAKNRP